MDKKVLIRTIKDKLELFEFRAIGKGAGAVILFKENESTKEQIVISYRRYPGIFNLRSSVTGWKEFKVVEQILTKYFIPIDLGENTTTIHHNSKRFEELDEIDITTPEDIEKVLPQLRAMVYEDILPFFERYQTIHQVYEEMESLEKSEISKFIFYPPTIRMMIIKRLCNDTNWDGFASDVVNNYIKWSEGPNAVTYLPYAQFLPDLYEELKGMHPLSQS